MFSPAAFRRSAAFLLLAAGSPTVHFAAGTHYHRGTPALDGMSSPGEWAGAEAGSAEVVIPPGAGGGVGTVTFLVMNDDDNIYLAAELPTNTSPDSPASIFLSTQTWSGGPDECAEGRLQDIVELQSLDDGSAAIDGWFLSCSDAGSDALSGGTADTTGALLISSFHTFFEIAHPLDSSDDEHDLSAPPPGPIWMDLFAGGCDAELTCGTIAHIRVKVFLATEDTIFFDDFETGDTTRWDVSFPNG